MRLPDPLGGDPSGGEGRRVRTDGRDPVCVCLTRTVVDVDPRTAQDPTLLPLWTGRYSSSVTVFTGGVPRLETQGPVRFETLVLYPTLRSVRPGPGPPGGGEGSCLPKRPPRVGGGRPRQGRVVTLADPCVVRDGPYDGCVQRTPAA